MVSDSAAQLRRCIIDYKKQCVEGGVTGDGVYDEADEIMKSQPLKTFFESCDAHEDAALDKELVSLEKLLKKEVLSKFDKHMQELYDSDLEANKAKLESFIDSLKAVEDRHVMGGGDGDGELNAKDVRREIIESLKTALVGEEYESLEKDIKDELMHYIHRVTRELFEAAKDQELEKVMEGYHAMDHTVAIAVFEKLRHLEDNVPTAEEITKAREDDLADMRMCIQKEILKKLHISVNKHNHVKDVTSDMIC